MSQIRQWRSVLVCFCTISVPLVHVCPVHVLYIFPALLFDSKLYFTDQRIELYKKTNNLYSWVYHIVRVYIAAVHCLFSYYNLIKVIKKCCCFFSHSIKEFSLFLE